MKSIPCPLKENAVKHGDQPAIISDNVTLTYQELDRKVDLCAGQLIELGIKKDDKMAIASLALIESLIVLPALWRIGAVACLINDKSPESIIGEQLKNIRCKVLLTASEKILQSNQISIPKITPLILRSNSAKTLKRDRASYAYDQPATIIFTSGSQSQPKAVQHSFANHYYSAKGSDENIKVELNDKWLLSLPLYHVSGLSIFFRCLIGAGTVVFADKIKKIEEVIDQFGITHISFVSTQLYKCLSNENTSEALKKLKCILLGGGTIADSLISDALKLGLPIYTSYGLTEMASQVATTKRLEINEGNAFLSKAKILKYRKACIADNGEILVSGETLFQGYVNNGRIQSCVDQDGWFHTKDIGSLDNDKFLTVKGRKDSMFISGGENIFPEEIESCLKQIDMVEQAVVVAVPSDEYGFRPIAFIKPKRNAKINRASLLKHLNPHLPKFKIPKEFYFWPDKIISDGIKVKRKDFIDLAKRGADFYIS